jgi:hypothetical protein
LSQALAQSQPLSYSGGSHQEDRGSRPACFANSLQDLILEEKKKSQKRTGGVAHGIGPEFKSQSTETTKKHF